MKNSLCGWGTRQQQLANGTYTTNLARERRVRERALMGRLDWLLTSSFKRHVHFRASLYSGEGTVPSGAKLKTTGDSKLESPRCQNFSLRPLNPCGSIFPL